MPSDSTQTAGELHSIQFPGESTVYIAPTWAELYGLASSVARQIKRADQTFDEIVTLANGGWPMAVVISDLLDIGPLASIGVKFYTGVDQRLTQPEMYHPLPVKVTGKRILLFDDVADTGESLAFVKAHLLAEGAELVQTATLLFKPHSKLHPDYYGAETTAWVVFPHDVVESIQIIGQRWRANGISVAEIESRLAEFGFQAQWVREYLGQKTL